MFRRSLLAGLMIIMAGGLTAAIGGRTAAAATSAPVCPVSAVIEITHFAFNPPVIPSGQSSTATLTAQNCTDQTQQTSEIWSGRFVDASGTLPPGCPVIDPIAIPVNFPPLGTVPTSVRYTVPPSCAATQLIVTVDISGKNGVLLAMGTAVLLIEAAAG